MTQGFAYTRTTDRGSVTFVFGDQSQRDAMMWSSIYEDAFQQTPEAREFDDETCLALLKSVGVTYLKSDARIAR